MGEYYTKKIGDIEKELKSNLNKGLDELSVKTKLKEKGLNKTVQTKKTTAFDIFRRQFDSIIIYVLYIAAFFSFLVGEKIEYTVIVLIIIIIVILGFVQEFQAKKDMEALQKLSPKITKVIRSGKEIEINAEEIVVGDIIVLKRGDIVPADARIFESSDFKVDESALTGEVLGVSKNDSILKKETPLSERSNTIFSGSPVINGKAKAIIISTGNETEIGKIASLLESVEDKKTPLQERIDVLGKQFSIAIFIICGLIFTIGILRGNTWGSMIILVIALSVAGIPESLPAVVAVVLAIGTKRMAKQNAIIKKLPAVETLGNCTIICSDKTGTLTQNKMVVTNVFVSNKNIDVTGDGFNPDGEFAIENKKVFPLKDKQFKELLTVAALCNNSKLKEINGEWEIEGEPTDGALAVLTEKAGLSTEALNKKYPKIHENPFDADRKCMSVIHKYKGKKQVFAKGAPEMLLEICSNYKINHRNFKLTEKEKNKILSQAENYAKKGLRVLALATKEFNSKSNDKKNTENNLSFVGLVAMKDPPRNEVESAIKDCQNAGIKVVMITGDNEITAKSIATELGIFKKGDISLTGKELDSYTDNYFREIINDVSVYARMTPSHKLRIVKILQEKEHVVAMTGDGVNDAPALKQADIGVAMGLRGTEVAKEAAEMVIKDDNFATIVKAIKEGRTIYDNVKKFLYYLLAGNFSQVILVFIASLIGVPMPLTALMILFVNLVTSEFPALGLCMEPASPTIMKRKPINPKEKILNEYLFFKIAQVIPIIVLGTILLYVWELAMNGATYQEAQTIAFVTVIMFMIFHGFNSKSFHRSIFSGSFYNNKTFFFCMFLSVASMLLIVYLPAFQNYFGTVGLNLRDWGIVTITSSSILLFIELQKTMLHVEMNQISESEIFEKPGY